MNQLAVVPQTPLATPAQDFSIRDMERMAVAFAQSGLFGVKTPDQALALCLLAHAEGRHPALAARDYDIIDGKPSKKAEAMMRDFIAAGGRVEWQENSDTRCCATFSHSLGGTLTIDWDMERAKKAGLASKAVWTKYPRAMLRSRVVSEGVRSVFPTATSGMYVPEEVRDFSDDKPTPATPEPKRARNLTAEVKGDDKAGREKAEAWVADQRAAVEAASDMDALTAVIESGHKAVAKLAREHADLHIKLQGTYEAKARLLNFPADAGDPGPAPEDEE